jgi:hypothetical protein
MITATLYGGLGNQLFIYACARALSLRLGTKLQLDTSNVDADPKREYMLHYFRGVTQPRVTESKGRIIEYWGTEYKPELFDGIEGDVTLRGYWQSWKYFIDQEKTIRTDLQLRSADLSREAVKMAGKINSSNSVMVHVRMGDYRTEEATRKVLHSLPETYYDEALKTIIAAETYRPHVFLFSDEMDEAKKLLGITRHKNLTCVTGMTDIEDLWLMANCRHAIIANSSFSWWAAFANNKKGITIAPKNWHIGQPSEDLCPPSWLRL